MSTAQAQDQDGHTIEAIIFDMDGVVTDTAEMHFTAWKAVFDAFLTQRSIAPLFTRQDYLAHVDGVPRLDGIRRFLAARDIPLPEGSPGDRGADTVHGLAALKNRRFVDWLERGRVPVFEDALMLLRGAKAAGLHLGIISASRNANWILKSTDLRTLFDAAVIEEEAQALGLAPKPDPAQLLEAARQLGCPPSRIAVIEDAVAGVQAASRGRFGLVIGVNRQQEQPAVQRHALRSNGADLVTRDLARLLLPDGSGLKTLDRLPAVWDRLEEFEQRLAGRPLAVFLDFDGVLAPIVADYRKAEMPQEIGAALSRLAARARIAVISGRDLEDVRARVGLTDVIYAGSHGFDIAGPGGLQERPEGAEGFLGALEAATRDLRAGLQGIAGAEIERKTFSTAVHYRNVAEGDVEKLEQAVEQVAGRHEKLRLGRGKKVIEIQPRTDWDKGRAVEWLLGHTPLGDGGALPLYIGDDITDEDAFAALSSRGISLALRGGGRITQADYALDNPADVGRFLSWLTGRLPETA